MKWRKLGLIYAPSGEFWWAKTHGFLPTADIIDEQIIRVYFASLDENLYGRIGFVDLDTQDRMRIINQATEPVLDLGELGTFDDAGVNASCIVNVGNEKYLYYIGWQRCQKIPYMLFSGLAISQDDGKTFTRYSRVPVLDRTANEPFSRSAPFVLIERGIFKAWYWSCNYWSNEGGWTHYNNTIRYAESHNGKDWSSTEHVCIALDGTEEYAVGRPWIRIDHDVYKMWYSIRSRAKISYRIGYAESSDGIHWLRKDHEAGITASEVGWDSEMICFSSVVDVRGNRYMFYNGNRHGLTGFGYAILEQE